MTGRRAGSDPEQAGIGQRIAQIALHRRTRRAQPRTHRDREQGARQAQFGDDQHRTRFLDPENPGPPGDQRQRNGQ